MTYWRFKGGLLGKQVSEEGFRNLNWLFRGHWLFCSLGTSQHVFGMMQVPSQFMQSICFTWNPTSRRDRAPHHFTCFAWSKRDWARHQRKDTAKRLSVSNYPLLVMLREKLQNVSSRHLSKDHPSHFHVQTQATQLPSWQRQTLMSKYHFVWPNGDPKLVLLDCSRTRTRLVFVSINDNDEWRFPCKQLKWYVVKGIHNITEENDEKRTIKPKKKMWVWNICFNFVR